MKSEKPIKDYLNFKFPIAIISLIGTGIILVSTKPHGPGISPDSVTYLSLARNLLSGEGFVGISGEPVTRWPPLFPFLLAISGKISNLDPLFTANFVNACIFGLIIYFCGILSYKFFLSIPPMVFVGTFVILVSTPLFYISAFVWSEPLFILLSLICLIVADIYQERKSFLLLMLLAFCVSLSSITKFIGVSLTIWGIFLIIISKNIFTNKIKHVLLFLSISMFPISLWTVRNYIVSSTLFGPRASSKLLLTENLDTTFHTIINWFSPLDNLESLAFVLLIIILFTCGSFVDLKAVRYNEQTKIRIYSLALQSGIYLVLLMVLSTTTAMDNIDSRLLAPIYIPITFLFLHFLKIIIENNNWNFPGLIKSIAFLSYFFVFILVPLGNTIESAKNIANSGWGYNRKAWRNSETIQYLRQHTPLHPLCSYYSNDPWAIYFYTNNSARISPQKTHYNSNDPIIDISSLQDYWDTEGSSCLIWFDLVERNHLFTLDELKTFVELELVVKLDDGAIYYIIK